MFKKLGRFETHHRILFYSMCLLTTIILMRVGVQIYNPNPVLFHLELHHFDYGVILLLVTAILLLFGSRKFKNLYLLMAAVSSAMIIDGYLALRLTVVESHELQLATYNGTIGPVVVIVVVVTLAVLFINSLANRKRVIIDEHKR